MSALLMPGIVLAHYRVVSFLGAGGMGEVYLARDETLGRNVALKVLPPALTMDEQRLHRFMQEARTASSLSHPNIVTIHEILEADLPTEGDATAAPPPRRIHFIAMEHIAGSTLRELIYREPRDLRTLLRYLAQAADGLAKAHAAGVVHRDLKPDNIMVTEDGFAKILDFGLAKLIEPEGATPGAGATATATARITLDGVVVGTAAYMSPEQVQAKDVDHRSDIFSFGCMLYEAATRCRPFAADSSVEEMHRILRESPVPIEELNPDVPAELRRLIRRCLAKSPDQRLQSMKDVALELGEIVEEYDRLPISSDSRPAALPAAPLPAARRNRAWRFALVGVAAIVIAGLLFGLWSLRRHAGRGATAATYQSMQISSLVTVANLIDNTLSPDGKYLALVTRESGRYSLRIRQTATGSDVQVLPPQENQLSGVRFTPDGNYVYYLLRDPQKANYNWLYRIPTLGGTPMKVAFDVDSPPAFSPDGRQIAFIRYDLKNQEDLLQIANADGSGERRLLSRKYPLGLWNTAPSWSPDGRRIVLVQSDATEGRGRPVPVEVALDDGSTSRIRESQDMGFIQIASLPDGGGLVAIASGWNDPASQIWFLSPDGKQRRITNDLNEYSHLSVSSDSKTIAAAQIHRRANLWRVPASDPAAARAITEGPGEEGLDRVCAGPSGVVIFTAATGFFMEIWSLDPESGRRTRLIPEGARALSLRVAGDAGVIAFTSRADDGSFHVWRMDADGGNRSQVTHGAGEHLVAISPDGHTVLYWDLVKSGVWKMPISGGEPQELWKEYTGVCAVSRDGRFVLHDVYTDVGGLQRTQWAVTSIDGGPPIRIVDVPPGGGVRWAPSGDALSFIRDVDGVQNIWVQPTAGGAPMPITRFDRGRIFSYDWSPDGSEIFLSRGEETAEVVLIKGFR
jgi:serine/threonine protein kinase/Tol biopolymer transport system component